MLSFLLITCSLSFIGDDYLVQSTFAIMLLRSFFFFWIEIYFFDDFFLTIFFSGFFFSNSFFFSLDDANNFFPDDFNNFSDDLNILCDDFNTFYDEFQFTQNWLDRIILMKNDDSRWFKIIFVVFISFISIFAMIMWSHYSFCSLLMKYFFTKWNVYILTQFGCSFCVWCHSYSVTHTHHCRCGLVRVFNSLINHFKEFTHKPIWYMPNNVNNHTLTANKHFDS